MSFLVLAPALVAQVRGSTGGPQATLPAPRRPRGIYAKVNIASNINQQQKANPSITTAELNAYFDSLDQELLGNPAISGLALQVHWDTVNPSPPATATINLQVPNDTATGIVPVMVTTASGSATSAVTLAPFGPSFFLLDASHVAGIILRSNGSGTYGGGSYDIIGPTGTALGYPTVAAKAGDIIELFGTGFGPTNPAVPAGQAFSGAAPTTNPVTLRINNLSVTPTFAGLSGAGLYQLNLTIPSGLGTGDVSLQASVGGVQTPSGGVISLQ